MGKCGHLLIEIFFPFGFNSGCSRALLSCWIMPGSVDFQHNKPELQNWPVTDHCKPGPDFKPVTKQWKTPYFIFYSFYHKYNLFNSLVAQWTQASGAAEVPCETIGGLHSLGQHCLCFIWYFLCLKFCYVDFPKLIRETFYGTKETFFSPFSPRPANSSIFSSLFDQQGK